jgi:D-alanyl-D-alanine carboxypeptidase
MKGTQMLRVSLLILGVMAALAACSSQPKPPDAAAAANIPVDQLRARVVARFNTLESPGAVYGVFAGPHLDPALVLTLGYADEDHSRPIRRNDHFRIASVTKTFVGTVILQMVDEGLIALDDPISRYVKGVPGGDNITIAMLGYHTSGLPRVIANPAYQKAIVDQPQRHWKTDERLGYAWQMDTLFPPGKGWMYSNTNTILLGEVIEKVSGRPWYEEVDRRICRPLGLANTGYPKDGTVPAPTPRGYRFGKEDNLIKYGTYWFDATDWSGSCWGAAGDMYSTLDDLAVFTRAAARGELVSAASRVVLFKWIDTGYEGVEYGFHIARREGAIGSTGDVPGFSAMVSYLPDRDITIISLANLTATRQKSTAASELGELMVEMLNQKVWPGQ